MIKKIFLLFSFLIAMNYTILWAYDGDVHYKINENATSASKLNLILQEQLGLSNGQESNLKSKNAEGVEVSQKIWEWISYGGKAEDYGKKGEDDFISTRAYNHFHNPLEEWDNAGLNNLALDILYYLSYSEHPVSPILWGLNPGQQDFEENTTGDWSWGKAKESFYIYLTGNSIDGDILAITEDDRNAYLADCFRALGQTMHLLQDMSVPLHTRNDVHIFPIGKMKDYKIFWNYETYALKNVQFLDYTSKAPDETLLNDPNPDIVYSDISPVSGLFDRNQYDGATQPENNELLGLAEYSNANFLSADTIFVSDFPYPRTEDCVVFKDTENDRRYIKIDDTSNGEKVNHLAAVSWLYFWRLRYFPEDKTILPIGLDNECYEEYTSFLIPRAVGYSAALLDYFFRGNIELSIPDDGFYALTDNPAQGFTSIKVKAKNITNNNEDMNDGEIELVVKYRISSADPFKNYDENNYPPTSNEMYYIKVPEKNGITAIPNDQPNMPPAEPVELTFDLNETPIPLWATDVYLQVVYNGQLGNESDAVAVGFKDISEPTPIDLFNNRDKICLDTTWHDAGSSAAIAYVDDPARGGNDNGIADEWDVYSHDLQDIYYRFYPVGTGTCQASSEEGEYHYHIDSVSAGEFDRSLYILSDYEYEYSFIASVIGSPDDPWTHNDMLATGLAGPAIRNQIDWDGIEYIRNVESFYVFRGVEMWSGIRAINQPYPDPEDVEACLYEELE